MDRRKGIADNLVIQTNPSGLVFFSSGLRISLQVNFKEKTMSVTINQSQQLFVIPCGEGFTTAGFDYIMNTLKQIAAKINGKPAPGKLGAVVAIDVDSTSRGTIEQYNLYQEVVVLAGKIGIKSTWYNDSTPKAVRRILEKYLNSNESIRVFLGDRATGRDWMGEYDTIGRIGRSTGVLKVPLLISEGDDGGPALLDGCIVKLMDVETHRVLWQHSQYHQASMKIVDETEFFNEGYTHGVQVGGENHARFRSYAKAAQFVAFLAGESMEQPS